MADSPAPPAPLLSRVPRSPFRRAPKPLALRSAFANATPLLLVLVAAGGAQAASKAEDSAPRITIVDGGARVFDHKGAREAVAGDALDGITFVDTRPGTRVLRLEWPEGQALDIGPDTRLMISPPGFGTRERKERACYVLSGWVKITAPASGPAEGCLFPALDTLPFKGTMVVHVGAEQTWMFAEAGQPRVQVRLPKAGPEVGLKLGESVRHKARGGLSTVAPRPDAAELKAMPVVFRDTLPWRLAKVAGKVVTPPPLPALTYDERRDWLLSETTLRRQLPRAFSQWAKEPEFYAAMRSRPREHGEWRPLIFPPPPPPPPPPPAPPPPSPAAADRTGKPPGWKPN